MVNLITEDYLKKVTSIYSNVDITDLKAALSIAQDIEVQNVLRKTLYNELIDAVKAKSLTDAQKALIAVISPMLAHFTVVYALPTSWAKFTASGIVNKAGENASAVDVKGLQFLRNYVQNIAESYAQKVVEFIEENKADYPSYTAKECTNTSNNAYRSGMYFE